MRDSLRGKDAVNERLSGTSARRFRLVVFELLQGHRWILPSVFACALIFLIRACGRSSSLEVQVAAAALGISGYVWGYATRALRRTHPRWPKLLHLKRTEYEKVWDTLSTSQIQASEAAAGLTDEPSLVMAGKKCAKDLIELLTITETDEILEIGCGVGRVGLILSTCCRSWTGADISSNMLKHAAGRLAGLSNVTLVHLTGAGLQEFRSESFDVIYSTNVFAHIDELDRWRYVEEGFRVLRPGGRIYVDNVNLEEDAGWSLFVTDYVRSNLKERPPYIPRPSTASELTTYLLRAGFTSISSHSKPPVVVATGAKPERTLPRFHPKYGTKPQQVGHD